MATNDTYFQFPLCCLARGPDHVKRLHAVVEWCICHVAQGLQNMTLSALQERVSTIAADDLPGDMKKSSREYLAIAAARQTLHVKGGGVFNALQQFKDVSAFVRKLEEQHGRFPFVRMRNDLLWDAINGRMHYRDFAVLAGVYSVIGAKEYPVRITRQRIIAGALGYKSPAMLTPAILSAREDKAKPLTENQLRRTLDALEARSLFTRVQASARKVYFSHRMTRDEMAEKIIATHVKRATKIKSHRQEDRLLSEKIAATIKAVNPVQGAPRNHQSGTTKQPRINREKHHFNINSFIESSLIKTPFIEAVGNTVSAPAGSDSLNTEDNQEQAKQEHPQPIPPPQERIEYWLNQFNPSKPGCKAYELMKVVSGSATGNKVFTEARQRLSDEIIRRECAHVQAMKEANEGMEQAGAVLVNRLKDRLKEIQ